jgi:hypothetical protein
MNNDRKKKVKADRSFIKITPLKIDRIYRVFSGFTSIL